MVAYRVGCKVSVEEEIVWTLRGNKANPDADLVILVEHP